MLMLDPTAIANPSDYTKDDIQGLYVRRFKHDVQEQIADHIPERSVMEAHATASAAEEAAFDVLSQCSVPLAPAATRDLTTPSRLVVLVSFPARR